MYSFRVDTFEIRVLRAIGTAVLECFVRWRIPLHNGEIP